MQSNFEAFFVIISILLIILAADVAASIGIWRDSTLTKGQRVLQLAFVWIVPVLGAITTAAVRRYQRSEQPVSGREPWTSISENEAVTYAVGANDPIGR